MHGHRPQDVFSLAYHDEVIRHVEADPRVLERARTRLDRWVSDGALHPHYAAAWRALLDQPWTELRARLREDSDEMQALRQASPFAGTLSPKARWSLRRRLHESGFEPHRSTPDTNTDAR